jgi:hypothetical protein
MAVDGGAPQSLEDQPTSDKNQLTIAVSARSIDRLSDDDERRYRERCGMERFLLRRPT